MAHISSPSVHKVSSISINNFETESGGFVLLKFHDDKGFAGAEFTIFPAEGVDVFQALKDAVNEADK